jgi:hypothetical protein
LLLLFQPASAFHNTTTALREEYNDSTQRNNSGSSRLEGARLLQHIHKHKNALWKTEWHQALCSVAQDGMYMQLPLV